jgi:PIN domain nuclease of toxin-antitoxin system
MQLADPRTTVIATVVSLWEITMKHRTGKFPSSGSAYRPFIAEQQIALIDLRLSHLDALEDLGMRHPDPFDHLILAQAKAEGAVLMTSDDNMRLYGIPCIDTD